MPKKKRARTITKVKPFSLKDHLDVPTEAEKFELTEAQTLQNIQKVENEPQVTVTETQRSEDQLDRFRKIYAEELERQNICTWGADKLTGSPACLILLTSPEQALAHLRWHLALQSFDVKTARATIVDIEDRLFPVESRTTTIHLSLEERQKIVERQRQLEVRQLESSPTNIEED